jgi:hypothetical protein
MWCGIGCQTVVSTEKESGSLAIVATGRGRNLRQDNGLVTMTPARASRVAEEGAEGRRRLILLMGARCCRGQLHGRKLLPRKQLWIR